MRVTIFRAADGSEVAFSPHQQLALDRAGRWRAFGYKPITSVDGLSTYRDGQIVEMIRGYKGLTRIFRPHLMLRDHTRPYVVTDPRPNGTERPCVSFESALDVARMFGCNVVEIALTDLDREFFRYATSRAITLLVV
jgi:hypothetical protein